MLDRYTEEEVRSKCRSAIESLELWLRNLIDFELTKHYGREFYDFQDQKSNRLLNSSLVKVCKQKLNDEPGRYSRFIDTTFLNEIIDIVCNPNLYNKHFHEALKFAFPLRNEQARYTLRKLIEPRNPLSHANPISERQAEQVLCYSHDVIDSIKAYYKEINMGKEYNVPTITSFSDSFGNKFFSSQFVFLGSIKLVNITELRGSKLYPGDNLSIYVEVDESFDQDSYTVHWQFINGNDNSIIDVKKIFGTKLTIEIEEKHVRELFKIECCVTSKKSWHRLGKYDDKLTLMYKILPLFPG